MLGLGEEKSPEYHQHQRWSSGIRSWHESLPSHAHTHIYVELILYSFVDFGSVQYSADQSAHDVKIADFTDPAGFSHDFYSTMHPPGHVGSYSRVNHLDLCRSLQIFGRLGRMEQNDGLIKIVTARHYWGSLTTSDKMDRYDGLLYPRT